MKYGTTAVLHKRGIMLVINGHIFSVFKGTNTGHWQATYTQNIWRKTKEALPSYTG